MFAKLIIDKMDKKASQHPQQHHSHHPNMNQSVYYPLKVSGPSNTAMPASVSTTSAAPNSMHRNRHTRQLSKKEISPIQPDRDREEILLNRYYSRKAPMVDGHHHQVHQAHHHHHQTSAQQVQLQQQHPGKTNADLSEKLAKINRRAAIKELGNMQQKNMQACDKNEEALKDLQESIPEISKIFDVHCRIGSGTFSTVLLGTLQRERCLTETQRRRFAIKHHNPTNHPERILRELECMFRIGGVDNVIGINCCIRYNDNVAFVMPYMTHDRFHDIYRQLSFPEVRDYLRNLLIALRHVHKFNVIHRDVKPSNILYNRRTGKFLLCDFGLAQRIADDGSIVQSHEISAQAVSTLMKNVENGLVAVDGNSAQAEAADYMANRRTRALGGGVAPGCDSLANIQKLREQLTSRLTKKDAAAQKADTLRLVNRLRLISPNVDPNNYVVPTNNTKKETHASRAGTPGYRPPEVLLRHAQQTTAVDVWAAGVIMLSMLSSLHPFFKAPNDCAALSEIINLFGDVSVKKTAFMLDRLVMLSQKVAALDLRRVCMRFRYSDFFLAPEIHRRYRRADGTMEMCRNCEQPTFNCLCRHSGHQIEMYDGLDIFPPNAYDLLSRLLEVNPDKRISAEEALKHPFFSDQHRILPGLPVINAHILQHQQQLASKSRSLKPYVSYSQELSTETLTGGTSTTTSTTIATAASATSTPAL